MFKNKKPIIFFKKLSKKNDDLYVYLAELCLNFIFTQNRVEKKGKLSDKIFSNFKATIAYFVGSENKMIQNRGERMIVKRYFVREGRGRQFSDNP